MVKKEGELANDCRLYITYNDTPCPPHLKRRQIKCFYTLIRFFSAFYSAVVCLRLWGSGPGVAGNHCRAIENDLICKLL